MIIRRILPSAMLLIAGLLARTANGDPDVEYLYPAGGQVGETVEVTVGGKLPSWPVRAWVDRAGLEVTAVEQQEEGGKHSLSVQIHNDAEPGIYWLRLYDASGSSSPRPFVVGSLAENAEQEPNDSIQNAQCPQGGARDGIQSIVFNGRLQAGGDVDLYAIEARHGQTLVADFDAHWPLGSSVDAVMQMVSSDGFVVAQNDDHQSLDPRLAVAVPRDGIWLVRVFGFPATPTSQIQLAGSPAYIYRLTITTGPAVDYALPLAAQTEGETHLRLFGWNLEPSQGRLTVGPEPHSDDARLQVDGIAHTIRIPFVAHPSMVEAEPNSAAEPQAVEPPITITGRIAEQADEDVYELQAHQGRTLSARIESRAMGYPLDAVLELQDTEGKQLARSDDSGGSRDTTLEHQPQQDGPLRLFVRDLHRAGGHNFVYRLSITRALPKFELNVGQHQMKITAGQNVEVPVTIARRHGHQEPIEIVAHGLPDGVTAEKVASKPGTDSDTQVKLKFQANSDAVGAGVPIRIVGVSSDAVPVSATISHPLAGRPLSDLWLTVGAKE